MLSAFANCWKIPELRKRIGFTLGLLFISRLIAIVPTPGVDGATLRAVVERAQEGQGGFLSWIDLFSGGALSNCAVGALSIWPYISASIILQLLTAIIPALERMVREGESGRQRLNQYTRYLTLAICVFQALFLAVNLENPASIGLDADLVAFPGWGFRLMTILTMTTGTMLLMWLGEQITERGIGNGTSMIIMINIVNRLPTAIFVTWNQYVGAQRHGNPFLLIALALLFFLVTAATVALTQGQRRIPIHTAKRVVGNKVYGGQNSYMPLRVNYSGVMPIIFAGALLAFPAALLQRLPWATTKMIAAQFQMGSPLYMLAYGVLILFFSYFWVATQFNPLQIADDLKRNGGYVPGIRPGRPTAEFLDHSMTRITLIGALFLTGIAVLPSLLNAFFGVSWLVGSFMGGTSLLIIVGVALDTMRQVEAHLLMRHYDGFLRHGRLRSRRG